MKRYAIFGGTFDPFTPAHRAIVKEVLDLEAREGGKLIDKVFVAPTIVNYHRPDKAAWLTTEERVECIHKALSGLTYGVDWELWDYDLKRQAMLKTCNAKDRLKFEHRFIDTLLEFKLHVMDKDDIVYVVLGTDSYNNLKTWTCYEEICRQAKLIVVDGRNGKGLDMVFVPSETLAITIPKRFAEISASKLREEYRLLGANVYMNTVLRDVPIKLLHTPIFDVEQAPAVDEANGLEPIKVNAPDWVTICAESNGQWVVTEQLRFGKMQNVVEFPCGVVEKDEDSKTAAIREFAEETGIKVLRRSDFQYIGSMSPNPAFMTNKMTMFYVNLDNAKFNKTKQQLDAHENLTWKFVPKAKFEQEIMEQVAMNCKYKIYNPAFLLAALKLIDWHKNRGGCRC